jgi:hypothetical protein
MEQTENLLFDSSPLRSPRVKPDRAESSSNKHSRLDALRFAAYERERGFSLRNVACSSASKTFNALISRRYDVQSGAAPNLKITQQMQDVQLEGLKLKAGEQLLLGTDTAFGRGCQIQELPRLHREHFSRPIFKNRPWSRPCVA